MWRALIVVCVAAGVARADDAKAVEAEVRAVLGGSQPWVAAAGQTGWYDRIAGIKLAGPSGARIATRDELERELADCGVAMITWNLGTPAIGVDSKRGFAWFQAPVDSDVSCMTPGFAAPTAHDKLRASGVLVVEKSKWRMVALALSRPLPDEQLFKGATKPPVAGDPTLDDSAAAKGAAAWFSKGGLARAKASGDVVASGTAPGEYATGAGAAKLVAAWDRLGLRADSIDATSFAGGVVALIRADVPLPVNKKAAPMTLHAIAIVDGKSWRWVSLQFTSELAAPPHAENPDTTGIECPHGKC